MKFTSKWSKWLIGSVAAVAVVAMAITAWPQTASAQGGPNTGGGARPHTFRQAQRPGIDRQQLLADALGITTEELQAAHEQAFDAALDQAVAEGLITQTQADFMKEHSGVARRGLGMLAPLQRFAKVDIDMEALLADALGISVDDLNAAKDAAFVAGLEQAVADGRLTQEQADQTKAQHDLKQYLQEQGLPEQLRSVYEQAVQQAVTDGIITQEQADQILSRPGIGFGGQHMQPQKGFRGHGGRGHNGRGAPGGMGFDFGGRAPSTNTGSNPAPTSFSL
ncbi:MAG: hypothetical protein GXP37_01825 [Chloroflexi bacterium]|nr:hypothetical protein [Chloroflexota bacterium]